MRLLNLFLQRSKLSEHENIDTDNYVVEVSVYDSNAFKVKQLKIKQGCTWNFAFITRTKFYLMFNLKINTNHFVCPLGNFIRLTNLYATLDEEIQREPSSKNPAKQLRLVMHDGNVFSRDVEVLAEDHHRVLEIKKYFICL